MALTARTALTAMEYAIKVLDWTLGYYWAVINYIKFDIFVNNIEEDISDHSAGMAHFVNDYAF